MLSYSGEGEAYVAEVSGLTRCVAWGESCEEALTQARGAIHAHYQLVREREDAIPVLPAGSRAGAAAVSGETAATTIADLPNKKSGRIRFTLDLSEQQHANLSYWSARSGSDRQRVVRALLRRMEMDEELAAAIIADLEAERVEEAPDAADSAGDPEGS